ncbi:MAG: DUF5062 family protein [Gammaproteobacteria bacterium SHHR-1]|uniref:DUF5062 family protein n=1 Tax=Magnetovirga frankeli TaxID=947516 RepID=UPI001293C3A0|nr:DUF5062 family protein [gamma proteobacterium SS-5]
MKKLKHEAELVKLALKAGMGIAERAGAAQFEGTDSRKDKLEYVYRLLVFAKAIQPLPKGQESQENIRHKLALWIQRRLPKDHPLHG